MDRQLKLWNVFVKQQTASMILAKWRPQHVNDLMSVFASEKCSSVAYAMTSDLPSRVPWVIAPQFNYKCCVKVCYISWTKRYYISFYITHIKRLHGAGLMSPYPKMHYLCLTAEYSVWWPRKNAAICIIQFKCFMAKTLNINFELISHVPLIYSRIYRLQKISSSMDQYDSFR